MCFPSFLAFIVLSVATTTHFICGACELHEARVCRSRVRGRDVEWVNEWYLLSFLRKSYPVLSHCVAFCVVSRSSAVKVNSPLKANSIPLGMEKRLRMIATRLVWVFWAHFGCHPETNSSWSSTGLARFYQNVFTHSPLDLINPTVYIAYMIISISRRVVNFRPGEVIWKLSRSHKCNKTWH